MLLVELDESHPCSEASLLLSQLDELPCLLIGVPQGRGLERIGAMNPENGANVLLQICMSIGVQPGVAVWEVPPLACLLHI